MRDQNIHPSRRRVTTRRWVEEVVLEEDFGPNERLESLKDAALGEVGTLRGRSLPELSVHLYRKHRKAIYFLGLMLASAGAALTSGVSKSEVWTTFFGYLGEYLRLIYGA